MNYFEYFIFFVFGAIVGSFLNVVSLRYQPEQKVFDIKIIGGRSRCPHCGKTLTWYELIPIISFLIQLGKCRSCRHRLSFQYPIVEILSGFIFLVVPWHFNNFQFSIINFQSIFNYSIIIWVLIFLSLLLIAIIDFRHFIIPDSLSLGLAILGIILLFINIFSRRFDFLTGSFLGHYSLLFGFRESIWFNYLLAGFTGAAFFALIIFITRGRAMGMGDVKLGAALGLIFGWPDILMVLFLSFLAGSLISVIFLALKRKGLKDMVPFGPFLASGACLTFLFGYPIIDIYFKIFSF